MSTLRSGIEEYAAEEVRAAGDAALEADVAELGRALGALEVERARRLAELDRRRAWRSSGALSLVAWLRQRFGMGGGEAKGLARTARALEAMPRARQALGEGELSRTALRLLVDARTDHPEAFAEDEAMLVEAARGLDEARLRGAIAYWRGMIDAEAAERGSEHLHERRRLHISRTLLGMVRLDADLDPETGEAVLAALQAITDAEVRSGDPEDRRSPAQRRADALGQVCRRFLDSPERPEVAGERPHATVVVDLEALQGGPGIAQLSHAGPITPQAARRLLCDANLARVLTRGRSEILEAGRRTLVVGPAMRRALAVRDGGCVFPGCGRPQSWCDAHHAVHWADGGETGLSNLVLLCRPHHRMIHARRFPVTIEEGRPAFTGPDGSPLMDRAPP